MIVVLYLWIVSWEQCWYPFQGAMKGQPQAEDAEYDFDQTKPGKGAVTSHYYRTFNIPERFDNPGMFHSLLQI